MLSRVLSVLAPLVALTRAFPSGAQNNVSNPMDAFSAYCTSGNFRPNHGDNLPQPSTPPYVITLNSPAGIIYRPGQPVNITLEGTHSTNQTFKGFFLQGDSTEASFAGEITCGDQGKKVSFCTKTGVTHVSAQVKDKINCQWSPPDFQIGRVHFVATVVHNFTNFWTGVKSSSTLKADPSTMTYQEKSRQMREHILRQIQQGNSAMGNLMGTNTGNPQTAPPQSQG